jgi:rare lipoprotein A
MKQSAVLGALTVAFVLQGCATSYSTPSPKGGGYYKNDRPPAGVTQATIDAIPPVVPKKAPFVKGTLKPYTALGNTYYPMQSLSAKTERGYASWYGTRYEGMKTSSGEIYDTLKLTAAHTTFPLPCFARVTNLENGRSIVVRVNDRGPFKEGRVMDVSYAAARKLGFAEKGSAYVQVDLLTPDDY